MSDDRDQIREVILRSLGQIAPEADLSTLVPNIEFRDQLDIDSFDFLNLVISLHEALGVDIPEADYSKLATLEDAIAYLDAARQDQRKPMDHERGVS